MAEKENGIKRLSQELSEYFEKDPSVFDDPKKKTHLINYRKNTFAGMSQRCELMFNNGQGDELEKKAKAIHSSSMLGYNFFSWITGENEKSVFNFNDVQYSKAYFEVQLPTLVGSNYFANMDIVLEGKDETGKKTLLFIESKFTEHEGKGFGEMKKMQDNSYSHNGEGRYLNYFPGNQPHVEKWHELIKAFNPDSNSGYLDGIKQEICHIIALSNLKTDNGARNAYRNHYSAKEIQIEHPAITGDENFIFYNVLYNWNESKAFENYKELYSRFAKKVQNIPSCNTITLEIISYRDIYNAMPEGALKKYLYERYIKFSK